MSTVPGFPSGSPVTATDILWITRGTGVDRDKKATVTAVLEGGMSGLVDGVPYANDRVPILQSGTDAAYLTLDYLVPSAFDAAKSTAKPDFDGIAGAGGVYTKTDVACSDVWCIVMRSPTVLGSEAGLGNSLHRISLEFWCRLKAFSGSNVNGNSVMLRIPEAGCPWFDEIFARLLKHTYSWALLYPYRYIKNDTAPGSGTACITVVGTSPNRYLEVDFSMAYSVLMPANNTAGATLQLQFDLLPLDCVGVT